MLYALIALGEQVAQCCWGSNRFNTTNLPRLGRSSSPTSGEGMEVEAGSVGRLSNPD